jgi:hypothetical protein
LGWNRLNLQSPTGVVGLSIGQDATHNLLAFWDYNAVAGSAIGRIETYGGNNPVALQVTGGNVGIGTPTPSTKMQVRGSVGVGGFFDASGIAATEIEILPAGGCVRTFMHTGATIWNSAGSAAAQAAQNVAVPGSGSSDLVMSGALTLRVYSTGRVTILRTSGTNTYTVAFAYVAI